MNQLKPFGKTPAGAEAFVWTLENGFIRVRVTNFGGRVVSIEVPDRSGRYDDVVLGFDDVAHYVSAGGSFGAVLGRTANRIADGSFVIEGRRYVLSKNDDGNTLHGGTWGFGDRLWSVEDKTQERLRLGLISGDGDQGFPGTLNVSALYEIVGSDLVLSLWARTDKPTPVNLSAHSYFNLGGLGHRDILDHEVIIPADHYLPTDIRQIPTGALQAVDGTEFDFRHPRMVRAGIYMPNPQLLFGKGYDHYFVLTPADGEMPRLAARVYHPHSGRRLEIRTTHPGVQFYAGNNLNGSVAGRGGIYRQSAGLALEPQGFPDAPNQPSFPSVILQPGETYAAVIRYGFTTE